MCCKAGIGGEHIDQWAVVQHHFLQWYKFPWTVPESEFFLAYQEAKRSGKGFVSFFRRVNFYWFYVILERFGRQNEAKNNRFSKKRVRRAERQFSEKHGFVLVFTVYLWGAYVRSVRKNCEIPTFCAEKRRPEKNGGHFAGFSDFLIILVQIWGAKHTSKINKIAFFHGKKCPCKECRSRTPELGSKSHDFWARMVLIWYWSDQIW